MTLTGYDAVDVADLPLGGDFYLGYVDGDWPNWAQVKQLHPTATILSVTVNGSRRADVCDCEPGNISKQGAASGLVAGLWPVIYSDKSDYPEILSLVGHPFPWYAADPTGIPHILPEAWATQWSWGAAYDTSWARDLSPFSTTDKPHPVLRTTEVEMLTRNTHGKGYWAARPSGDVYAYDGAPYLGPAPHFLHSWGIGTPTNPVVGIADDGHGGFVLEADTNTYPGQPALYRITADGRFKN